MIRTPVTWGGGFHACDHPHVFNGLYTLHLRHANLDWALARQQTSRANPKVGAKPGNRDTWSDEAVTAAFRGMLDVQVDESFNLGDELAKVAEIETRKRGLYVVVPPVGSSALYRLPERFRDVFKLQVSDLGDGRTVGACGPDPQALPRGFGRGQDAVDRRRP